MIRVNLVPVVFVTSGDLSFHYFRSIYSIPYHGKLMKELFEWLGTEKGKSIFFIKVEIRRYHGHCKDFTSNSNNNLTNIASISGYYT